MPSIHLLQIGHISPQLFSPIAQGIQNSMNMPIRHHTETLPAQTYDATRGQYHATRLLEFVESQTLPSQDLILGLTNVDLFIPILTFVFGEARLNKPSAILSLFRLMPQYYGLPPNDTLTIQRTITESVHELGHALGLLHCSQYDCAMHTSRTADDIDLKKPHYCPNCTHHLHKPHHTLT
jgi:archaemetzincin